MSTEEIDKKKQELIKELEAKKALLLEQHSEKMADIKERQKNAATIYLEGQKIEEQLAQLKSGPFAQAKIPQKKVS